MRKFLVVFVLLAAAGAGAWYLFYRPSPRYAVGRLGAAVATRDTAAIYRYADLAGISQSFAREVEEDAIGDGRTARLLEGILRGGSDRTNPYLISLAEQLVWTALMRADSGPAIAGHVVGARSVTSSRVAGDSAWAVVPPSGWKLTTLDARPPNSVCVVRTPESRVYAVTPVPVVS